MAIAAPNSLTTLLSSYNIMDSGDPLAVLEAFQAAFQKQMGDVVIGYNAAAMKNLADLTAVHRLSDDLNKLGTIDNGTSVVLGSDFAGSDVLLNRLGSFDLTLNNVVDRHYLTTALYDSKLNQVGGTPKHLATPSEWSDAQALPYVNDFGDGSQVRKYTSPDGSILVATLYPLQGTRTCSIADMQNLKDQVAAKQLQLVDAVDADLNHIQNATARMVKGLEDDDTRKQLATARKRETKVVDRQLVEQRESTEQAARLDLRENLRMDQNESREHGATRPGLGD